MNTPDQILRCFSILSALKTNIPNRINVSETWVSDFHNTIEKLERATGLDLAEFRLDLSDLKRKIESSSIGKTTYHKGLWCERSRLIQKLDSILGYFTGLETGQNRRIGFGSPK